MIIYHGWWIFEENLIIFVEKMDGDRLHAVAPKLDFAHLFAIAITITQLMTINNS